MAHDVFISYSTKDKATADAACAMLEANGIRCWMAPRDILPGTHWGASVIRAIGQSRVLVLVFSSHSNQSQQVLREVERGVSKGLVIMPLRIEDVQLSEDMEYFISAPHWLDALTPPLEAHLTHLAETMKLLLGRTDRPVGATELAEKRKPLVDRDGKQPTAAVVQPERPATVAQSEPPSAKPTQARSLDDGEIRQFKGHGGKVYGVAFSPDGRRCLSGSHDRTVRLWDVESGREVRRFEGHTGPVLPVVFSADGRRVLSGSVDGTVRLWDVETGQEIRRFQGHAWTVHSVAFSSDGRRALSGGQDKTVRLWDVESGSEIRRFEGHNEEVRAVLPLDGRRALSGSSDATVRLWDMESGSEIRRFEGDTSNVHGVAISPDGRRALSAHKVKTVRLWDVESGREVHRFEGHWLTVYSVAFSPDGRRALSAGNDLILLWDLESGQEIWRFGHASYGIAFSPDGRRALSRSGSDDKTFRLWGLPP